MISPSYRDEAFSLSIRRGGSGNSPCRAALQGRQFRGRSDQYEAAEAMRRGVEIERMLVSAALWIIARLQGAPVTKS